MPASAINPFSMSANSKSGSSQQSNNGSGVDFGATLSDARQSASNASNTQPAQKSGQDQNQQAQNQTQKSSNQDSDNSTDSATAASKAAARVAAAQNKQEAEPDSGTTAWLAMLQNMLGQTQIQTTPTDTSSTDNQDATSALSSLSALLSANQNGDADAASAADAKSLLQGLQAGNGKSGNDTADIAADDGNFLPLLQTAITSNQSTDDKNTDAAALAQLAAGQQHASQTTHQTDASKQVVPSHQIDVPVADNKWSEAVAQRVSLMVGKQEQQLDMQLNPPHLGPMEVRLSMAQDQASVIFTSQHANVREALAAATPRLTALLADQGITLTNVQVASDSLNQQAQQQQQAQRQFDGNQARNGNWTGDADTSVSGVTQVSTTMRIPVARSGLNLWA